MITVKDLNKYYGSKQVLNDVDFSVKRGEVLGFLGPNGAGKTTTMRIITGFISANSGSVTIDDESIEDKSLSIREKIGYLPENNPLYDSLRIYEYLKFIASIKQVSKPQEEIKRVVGICSLQNDIARPISDLSKGFRQRVGLAAALLGDPDILILDEPTSGLDPNQAAEIRKMIKEIGKTKTVIFSTHILQEVQASCDRALIINQGKIVGQGTVDELVRQAKGQAQMNITIEGPQDSHQAIDAIKQIPGVKDVKHGSDNNYQITVQTDEDIRRAVFKLCVDKNWILLEMQTTQVSLEEVFRELTTEKV